MTRVYFSFFFSRSLWVRQSNFCMIHCMLFTGSFFVAYFFQATAQLMCSFPIFLDDTRPGIEVV